MTSITKGVHAGIINKGSAASKNCVEDINKRFALDHMFLTRFLTHWSNEQ